MEQVSSLATIALLAVGSYLVAEVISRIEAVRRG